MSPSEERDPVCGMLVDPITAKFRHAHQGRSYFFCRPQCLEDFKADPAKYVTDVSPAHSTASAPASVTTGVAAGERRAEAPAHAPTSAAYVCPMDPEVRESKPGPCPTCGMALEREKDWMDRQHEERHGGLWAMWICLGLLALFLVSWSWR